MSSFKGADILIPKVKELEKWAVVACDQFTSQPEYWEDVEKYVGDAPSSLRLIFPEAMLGQDAKGIIAGIKESMEKYLSNGSFTEYKNAFIYIERTLLDGSIRKGIVGAIDLEEYDYSKDSTSKIRATEKTVEERIPPRKIVRENAVLELPHILLFSDDEEDILCGSLEAKKESLPLLYDFELMAGGGPIKGWLIQGENAKELEKKLEEYSCSMQKKYGASADNFMEFAVGDGNHSLATAKACYEDLKKQNPGVDLSNHPARYALVELVNIHDEAQKFEPIHRIVKGVDVEKILEELETSVCEEEGHQIVWYAKEQSGCVYLNKARGELALGILQAFLDEYLSENEGELDYIHGDYVVKNLSETENCIGFILPNIEKGSFFKGILKDGVFPRKTFSAGHAQEKRYYLEARKIITE